METWELWYGEAAAAGLPFARSKIDAAGEVLVHSAPPSLEVIVTDGDGRRIAHGKNLARTCEAPMCRLTRRDGEIAREDLWPAEQHVGAVVLLPGGEAGHLLEWQHAPDHSEWRWRVEFYNRKS